MTRLFEPGLSPRERAFLGGDRPAFTELVGAAEQSLYVGGGARLMEEMHYADLTEINEPVRASRSRVGLLGMLRGALDIDRARTCGSAPTTTVPYMRGLAMVAANYGLATRNLGTVSLIGPRRMDYAAAIRRCAAPRTRCRSSSRRCMRSSVVGSANPWGLAPFGEAPVVRPTHAR